MPKEPLVCLGIDPGITRIGYGLVKKEGAQFSLVDCGVIEISRKSVAQRLKFLENQLAQIVRTNRPHLVSLERLYFAKNKKTALGVAETRGAILLVLGRLKIPVLEFDPTEVKRTVAGDGYCSKRALAQVVAITLRLKQLPGPDDAHDALALAIRASLEPLVPLPR